MSTLYQQWCVAFSKAVAAQIEREMIFEGSYVQLWLWRVPRWGGE